MISLSDNETWRRLRLTPLLSSSKFPAFSALKCLQNSSIIQNNSVTLWFEQTEGRARRQETD